MYNVEKCSTVLEDAAGFERRGAYNVEKCSTVLEDVADFERRGAYMYGPITKWQHWGIFIHWGNFAFPQMLYELECHQR